jgi:uncharacterized protein (TIGR02145 family)
MKYFRKLLLGLFLLQLVVGCEKLSNDSWKELKSCPGIPSFEYQGQVYNTVQIGEQCWMVENLNIGDQIPGTEMMTDNNIVEKYCFDNEPANCDIYGGLYLWDEIMQYTTDPSGKGICPQGWHIPSENEYDQLYDHLNNYLKGDGDVYSKLKISGGGFWDESGNIEPSTNLSGFSALPAGFRNNDGSYHYIHWAAYFWSSKEKSVFRIKQGDPYGQYPDFDTEIGASVRCVKANRSPELILLTKDGSDNHGLNEPLKWTATDPDKDMLSYTVFFGESSPPELQIESTVSSVFQPDTLDYFKFYYWRVIVTDGVDTVDSGELTFRTESASCPGVGEIIYEGQTYHTIQIGDQCWMRENLNVGNMIPNDGEMINDGIIEKFCPENSQALCDEYGGLYQWNEMMRYESGIVHQGICPAGWRISSEEDWEVLIAHLGGRDIAGGKLKEINYEHWNSPNDGATNSSKFSGLGAGVVGTYSHYGLKDFANFWTTSNSPLYYSLSESSTSVGRRSGYYANKSSGRSVRCIKVN